MKTKKINWKKVEADDLRRACFHEAAHTVIAQCFGVEAVCTIFRSGYASREKKSWRGQTHFCKPGQATAYQHSVIGWAGALVEQLSEFPADQWQDEIEEVRHNVLLDFEAKDPSLSSTDRKMIKEFNQPSRSLNRACSLIVLHRCEIAEGAETMITCKSQPFKMYKTAKRRRR